MNSIFSFFLFIFCFSSYSYYPHGPLRRTVLGKNIQGLDYVYNLQGWLKAINHPLQDKDPGKDGQVSSPVAPDVFAEMINIIPGTTNAEVRPIFTKRLPLPLSIQMV